MAGEERSISLLPGQTTAIAGQAFGAGAAERLDIRPPEDTTAYFPAAPPTGTVEIDDITAHQAGSTMTTTATIHNNLPTDLRFVEVSAVYRDASGAIIGGSPGAIELVAAGESVPFEISDAQAPAGIESTEVYWWVSGNLLQ